MTRNGNFIPLMVKLGDGLFLLYPHYQHCQHISSCGTRSNLLVPGPDVTPFVHTIPIGSMYGIYAIIGGILMVNVTIYSIHGSYGFTRCLGASKIFKLCLFNSKSVSSLVYSLGGSSDPPIPISNTSYSKRPPYSGRSQKSLRILLIVLLEYFKINRRGFPKIRICLKNSRN